jgi:hypothetical protein
MVLTSPAIEGCIGGVLFAMVTVGGCWVTSEAVHGAAKNATLHLRQNRGRIGSPARENRK